MPTPVVIDLSHHNTIPESLTATKQAGIIGLIHKATEGTGHVDSKVKARRSLVKDAGLLWGTYHFITPSSSGKTQAQFYFDTMQSQGLIDDQTLVAADHENSDAALALLRDFLLTLRDLTKRMPVVYSGHVLKEQLADYIGPDFPVRLWLCHYTTGTPTLPPGFSEYWLWQYTDEGKIAGVNPPTDLNASNRTIEQLKAEWSGSLTEPEPAEPEPELDKIVTVLVPKGVKVEVIEDEVA